MTEPDKNTLQYRENTITSARPEDLTLMMYNGLIKFIARAQEEIRAKSLEAAHNTLIRCQDIVFEFQYTLNMDYSVSNNLMLLYDYLYNRLIEANAKKDCGILDEVLEFVTDLRDTWAEAIKLNKEQKASAIAGAGANAGAAENAGAALQEGTEAAASGEGGEAAAQQPGAAPAGIGAVATAGAAVAAGQSVASANTDVSAGVGVNTGAGANAAAASANATGAAQPGMTEVEVPGASVRIGTDAPAVSKTKAIYKRTGPPVMAAAAIPNLTTGNKTSSPQPDDSNEFIPSFGSNAKLYNPAAAAQYAKVAKAKAKPQEIISIASE